MAAEPYTRTYLDEMITIARRIDVAAIERLVELLVRVRDRGGRVFAIGVGGGAGNASHAVADLRTIGGIEAYAPTDSASGLTALTNDRGWRASLAAWLAESRLDDRDAVLVLSVGGGCVDPPVSENIVEAVHLARARGTSVAGIVGRDGGETARMAEVCVLVPVVEAERVTAHTESFQAVVWHLAVTHPSLGGARPRWESLASAGPGGG